MKVIYQKLFNITVIVLLSLYFIYTIGMSIINFSHAFDKSIVEQYKSFDKKIYTTYSNQGESFIVNRLGLPNSVYTIDNKKFLNYEVLDENNNDGATVAFDVKGNMSVSQVPINCSVKFILESNVLSKIENRNCSAFAYYNFLK